MRHGKSLVTVTWILLAGWGSGEDLEAQAIRITSTPIEPYESSQVQQQGRRERERAGTDAARYLSLYATAYLGEPGKVEGQVADSAHGFHYPSVHLVFSAAARPQPRGGEVSVAKGLHRLNAHVRVEPLDKDLQPIAEIAALEVLATFPDSQASRAHVRDTTKVATAAVSAVTRTLLPEVNAIVGQGKRLGPMITNFANVFHRGSAPTQVAYLSDHREFGWVWYEAPDHSIEGTHRAAATFEAGPKVRYLRVQVLLVADWQRHGAWQRSFEIVLDMGPGAQ